MSGLFEAVTATLAGSPIEGLGAAAALGALSVVISPCHLAGIPLVIGVVQNQHQGQRASGIALRFGLGVLVSFAIVGALTLALGRVAGDLGIVGNLIGATIFIAFGLQLLEVIDIPWFKSLTSRASTTDKSRVMRPAVVGLLFGASLGPCTFSFMAPVIGVAMGLSATAPVQAGGLLLSFAIAHTAIVVLAGIFGGATERFLESRGASRAVSIFRKVTGVLLILGGLYFIYTIR